MKDVSSALATLLTGYQFFVADLYTITLANGDVYRYTSGDGDLLIAGGTGQANASLLYHFDAYPFVESTGALINQGTNVAGQFTTTGQTFGTGAFFASQGSGHGENGGALDVTFLTEDPDHIMQPEFTFRFRYTPTTDTAGGYTQVLDVGSAIDMGNFTNSAFPVFRGFGNASVALSAGTSYAISIEAHNNNGYLYIDGVLAHTFVDLATNCYAYYAFNNPLRIKLGGTVNDVSEAGRPLFDEFLFVNGTALAAGASSYEVETVPFSTSYLFTAKPIEREDITLSTGVDVDDCKVILHCDRSLVFNELTVPNFALIGGFDNAHIKIELAIMPSYGDTSGGVIHLFEGRVTDVVMDMAKVELTVSSLNILLDTKIPITVYQPSCVHSLYDGKCGVNRAAFTASCSVLSGSTRGSLVFSSGQAEGFFTYGKITFLTGRNAGLTRTVKTHTVSGTESVLFNEQLPFTPVIGDSFTITAGCDKSRATCTSKFSNAANFLGWEYMPVPESSI
jgi:uncharacterized phage protein (TIGR02218 family)